MLSLLIVTLYFSSINTQPSVDDHEITTNTDCILPPQTKNGRYVVLVPDIPNLAPGDKLSNFTLEVSCDPGYHATDINIFQCFYGEYLISPSECLPYCTNVRASVLSCGLGDQGQESRCLVPDLPIGINLRNALVEEELNCGIVPLASAGFISGGRTAEKQELPWHAGIYTKRKQPYMQICGGSLVTETVVISAAHCFWSDVEKQRPASSYAVAVGKLYRPWNDMHDENAQKSDVAEVKIPPRFQGTATNLQDDIALVILASPFVFTSRVSPVCLDFDINLDEEQLTPGHLGKVAGWGLTSENGRESPVLKVVEMPVVSIAECIEKSDPSFRGYITSDKICAGYHNGTAVCKGDSGGGLSFLKVTRGSARYFLRGLVSAAPRNENLCNTLAWGTFTHVLKHEHFIRETVPAKSVVSV